MLSSPMNMSCGVRPHSIFSLRKVFQEESGMLRHLGWESSDTAHGSTDIDGHGILWEPFTAAQQDKAMRQTWPNLPNDPEP